MLRDRNLRPYGLSLEIISVTLVHLIQLFIVAVIQDVVKHLRDLLPNTCIRVLERSNDWLMQNFDEQLVLGCLAGLINQKVEVLTDCSKLVILIFELGVRWLSNILECSCLILKVEETWVLELIWGFYLCSDISLGRFGRVNIREVLWGRVGLTLTWSVSASLDDLWLIVEGLRRLQ